MEIEVHFSDLNLDKQREIYSMLGSDGGYNTKPIGTIHVGDYQIIEYKSEDRWVYDTEEEARTAFAKIEEQNLPGIWQLFALPLCKMIDEFIGHSD